jgi:hypothetical protein
MTHQLQLPHSPQDCHKRTIRTRAEKHALTPESKAAAESKLKRFAGLLIYVYDMHAWCMTAALLSVFILSIANNFSPECFKLCSFVAKFKSS